MSSATNATSNAVDMAVVLHALSDPVRLEIVRQLAVADAELVCGDLDLPVGKSTCSYHLRALTSAGVIAERQEGVRKYLRLQRAELDRAYPGLLGSVLGGIGVV